MKRTTTLAILSFITVLIEIGICGNLFPWTGLGAIIIYPLIWIISIVIIILGILVSRKAKPVVFTLTWIGVFILNSVLVIKMYPQEFRPSVSKQLSYTVGVLTDQDRIKEIDLKIYDNYGMVPMSELGSDYRERYVAALKKFESKIPRDSSFFLFGRTDNPVLDSTDIESKLETGQDKIIWHLFN